MFGNKFLPLCHSREGGNLEPQRYKGAKFQSYKFIYRHCEEERRGNLIKGGICGVAFNLSVL